MKDFDKDDDEKKKEKQQKKVKFFNAQQERQELYFIALFTCRKAHPTLNFCSSQCSFGCFPLKSRIPIVQSLM